VKLFEELNDKSKREKWMSYLQKESGNFFCEQVFAKELTEESHQINTYFDKFSFSSDQSAAGKKEAYEKLKAEIATFCHSRSKQQKSEYKSKNIQSQLEKRNLREKIIHVKTVLDQQFNKPIGFLTKSLELKLKIDRLQIKVSQIELNTERSTENKTGAYFSWFLDVINRPNIIHEFFEHLQKLASVHRDLATLTAQQSSFFDEAIISRPEATVEQVIHNTIRESIFREVSKYIQQEIKEHKLMESIESLIIENCLSSSDVIKFKIFGDIAFNSSEYDFELCNDSGILLKSRDMMLLHDFKNGRQVRFNHMVYDTSQRRMSADYRYVCIQHREGIDLYDIAQDKTIPVEKGSFMNLFFGTDRLIIVKRDYSIMVFGIKERQVLLTLKIAPNSFVISFNDRLYSMACSRDSVFYSTIDFTQDQDTMQPILQQNLREFCKAHSQPALQAEIAFGIAKLISTQARGVILKKPVFLVIIYFLDNTKALELFLESFGFQTTVLNLKLISLFYSKMYKPNMMKSILQQVVNYYDTYKVPLRINQTEMRSLILEYKSALVKEENYRALFSNLVTSKTGSEISCQFLDGKYLARIEMPEKETFTQETFEASLESTLSSLKDPRSVDISKFQPHISLIKLDLTPGSEFSFMMFGVMDRMDTNSLKTTLKPIIYHKWASVFKFAVCYTFLFWITTALAYIYFGYFFDVLPIGVVLALLNLLLILYEVKCWSSIGTKVYLSSIWNLTDLVIQSYCMFASILFMVHFRSSEFLSVLAVNWMRVTIVPLLLVRAITWLRIFSPTRYLITMVLQVFLDIRPFLIILTTVIFTFSYMWRISVNLIEPDRGKEQTFYETLYSGVFIIFGSSPDYQDDKPYDLVRFLVIILGNVVLALTMLNFLIAIISGTFENISEDKDLYDVKELITLIKDFDSFFSGWQRLVTREDAYFASIIDSSLLEKPDSANDESEKAQKSLDQIVAKVEEMDSKINQILKSSKASTNEK